MGGDSCQDPLQCPAHPQAHLHSAPRPPPRPAPPAPPASALAFPPHSPRGGGFSMRRLSRLRGTSRLLGSLTLRRLPGCRERGSRLLAAWGGDRRDSRAGRRDEERGGLGPEAGPSWGPGPEEDTSMRPSGNARWAPGLLDAGPGRLLRGSSRRGGTCQDRGLCRHLRGELGSWAEERGLQPAPGSSSSGSWAPAGILFLLPSGWELAWAVP